VKYTPKENYKVKKRGMNLKLNYIGIVAAILAFVSLALPWWRFAYSYTMMGISYSYTISLNTWGWSGLPTGAKMTGGWEGFSYGALVLVAIGGILGLVGSVQVEKRGKMLLLGAGGLMILSIIVFAVGLMNYLPNVANLDSSYIWYSGSHPGIPGSTLNTMLYVGFWLALVAAILAFISWVKHPIPTAPPPKQP